MKKEILILSILITIAVLIAYVAGIKAKEKEYTGGFSTYTVMPGETLWGIAEDLESNEDIRKIIYTIKKDNGLTESIVYAGQTIQLRTEY